MLPSTVRLIPESAVLPAASFDLDRFMQRADPDAKPGRTAGSTSAVTVSSKCKPAGLYANADGGDASGSEARGWRQPARVVTVELVLAALLRLLTKLELLFRADIVDMDAVSATDCELELAKDGRSEDLGRRASATSWCISGFGSVGLLSSKGAWKANTGVGGSTEDPAATSPVGFSRAVLSAPSKLPKLAVRKIAFFGGGSSTSSTPHERACFKPRPVGGTRSDALPSLPRLSCAPPWRRSSLKRARSAESASSFARFSFAKAFVALNTPCSPSSSDSKTVGCRRVLILRERDARSIPLPAVTTRGTEMTTCSTSMGAVESRGLRSRTESNSSWSMLAASRELSWTLLQSVSGTITIIGALTFSCTAITFLLAPRVAGPGSGSERVQSSLTVCGFLAFALFPNADSLMVRSRKVACSAAGGMTIRRAGVATDASCVRFLTVEDAPVSAASTDTEGKSIAGSGLGGIPRPNVHSRVSSSTRASTLAEVARCGTCRRPTPIFSAWLGWKNPSNAFARVFAARIAARVRSCVCEVCVEDESDAKLAKSEVSVVDSMPERPSDDWRSTEPTSWWAEESSAPTLDAAAEPTLLPSVI